MLYLDAEAIAYLFLRMAAQRYANSEAPKNGTDESDGRLKKWDSSIPAIREESMNINNRGFTNSKFSRIIQLDSQAFAFR